MIPRLRPTIFLPASVPWLVKGTLVEVFTLWVEHGSGRFGFTAFFHAGQSGQFVSDLREDSFVAPGRVVGVHRVVRREVVGKVFPGDSGPVDVEDRVEDLP